MRSITQIVKDFKTYMSSTDNPAKVTAEQTGAYSKDNFDLKLNTLLKSGTFSVNKYGDNSWTPPNVLGSFEGGQRSELSPYFAMLEEPDGKFCFLENACNGVKSGVYYTFLTPNPDGKTLSINPTPRRYEPPILASNPKHRVFQIYSSEGRDVVWGSLIDETSLQTKNFVSLTAGSMDASTHQSALIGSSLPVIGQARMVLVKDKLYVLSPDNQTGFSVWVANASDVKSGGTVEFTQLMGWKSITINGQTLNDDSIRFATSQTSRVQSDDSVVWLDTNCTRIGAYQSRQCTVNHPTDNKLRMLYQQSFNYYYTGSTAIITSFTIIIDIDFEALTATVLPETRKKVLIKNGTGNTCLAEGEMLAINAQYSKPPDQIHGNYFITPRGKGLILQYPNLGLGEYQYASIGTGVETTLWDKLHPSKFRWTETQKSQLFRRFGSLVGGGIHLVSSLPNKQMTIATTTTNPADGLTPQFSRVLITANTEYNGFDYITDNGPIKGYRPTTDRVVIKSNANKGWLISVLCTGTDKRITKISSPPLFPTGNLNSQPVEIVVSGADFISAGKGTYVLPATALAKIKAQATADMAGYFTNPSGTVVDADLWIPPSGGKRSYPAIATCQVYSPTELKLSYVSYQVNVTFASGSLSTGGTISDVTSVLKITEVRQEDMVGVNYTDNRAGGFVYEHLDASGNLLYSVVHAACFLSGRSPGGGDGFKAETVILPSESNYNPNYSRMRNSATWNTGYDPLFLVEGVGPVWINWPLNSQQGSSAIYYQKLRLGTTRDDYWNLTIDPNDPSYYIWVASQVAEDYNVYFTDNVPSLINGNYHLVGSSEIDLRTVTADPANKTFYVWLRLLNDTVSYVVTLNQNEKHELYIGKIVTNSTQIDSINVVKATVFDW